MNYNSIFSQSWWLDALAPNAWGEVTVEQSGKISARLPYVIKKRYGFTLLAMPQLTQTLGPWLSPCPGKYVNLLSEEKKLMTKLIEQLPKFDIFMQNFHYSVTNWLPFYWHGFEQTTQYTYVIEDLTNLDVVWRDVRKSVRTEIRKAQKQIEVRTDLDIDTFLRINEMTFQRQGKTLPYSREYVERLDNACEKQDCRKIFFAQDSQGKLHAAIYLIWDDQAAYYLMGGADPALRSSGATSLLMWEAIQFASTVTQTFDFEGSMIESVERFFRSFGAKQKPYFKITKTNSLPIKIVQDTRSWWRM